MENELSLVTEHIHRCLAEMEILKRTLRQHQKLNEVMIAALAEHGLVTTTTSGNQVQISMVKKESKGVNNNEHQRQT